MCLAVERVTDPQDIHRGLRGGTMLPFVRTRVECVGSAAFEVCHARHALVSGMMLCKSNFRVTVTVSQCISQRRQLLLWGDVPEGRCHV